MKRLTILAAAVLLSGAASAQTIDVGSARWSSLPLVKAKPSRVDDAALAGTVEEILRSGECKLRGQSSRSFDINVPYAVMLDPSGKAVRVLVSDLQCRPIEVLAGHVVVARSDAGDYLPTGEAKPRWYASAINFNLK